MRIFAIIVSVLAAMLYVLGPWITLFLVLVPFFFAKSFLRWLSMALIVVGLGACGEPDPPSAMLRDLQWTDLGIGIAIEQSSAQWAYDPDLFEHVDRMAMAVADYSGREVATLKGWIIVLRAEDTVDCGNIGFHTGCCWYHSHWIDMSTTQPPWATTVEASMLGHELLHALIDDSNHSDPLWRHVSDTIAPLVPEGAKFYPPNLNYP